MWLQKNQELKANTPLSKVSKTKLVQALKVSRIGKCAALQELNTIRVQLKEEHVNVSDAAEGRARERIGCSS